MSNIRRPIRKTLHFVLLCVACVSASVENAHSAALDDDLAKVIDLDLTFPLRVAQNTGLWLVDRCYVTTPKREVEFRRAYANWHLSRYQIETKVNGKLVSSDTGFRKFAEENFGAMFDPAVCEDLEATLARLETRINFPPGYLDQFKAN